MKKRMIIILGMLLLASTVVADTLVIQSVKIKNVEVFKANGYAVMRVLFEPTGTINTGCAPTDTHHIVSYWTTSWENSQSMWLAILLSAQAQSSNVDIYYDSATCNTNTSWNTYGLPYGLGSGLLGVRIVSP